MPSPSKLSSYATVFAAWFGCFAGSGCTAHIDAPEPASEVPELSQSEAEPASTAASAFASPSSTAQDSALGVWSGAVGSWCGPAETRTLWLTLSPAARACQAASGELYPTPAVDTSRSLTLELDELQLVSFPTEVTRPARYCDELGACADVQATLDIDDFTSERGLRGAWKVGLPAGGMLSGRIEAGWCAWDDFLPAHPEAERLARDIAIREVSVYQGVKVPIVRDLQAIAARNADLVQQREALVRIFVQPAAAFQSRPLSARVTLQDDGRAPRRFEQTIEVSGASSDQDPQSTFNIELPKDAFGPTTRYSVELRETARCQPLTGSPVGARFPEQGQKPLGARATGPVKVMIVPVRYQADGSGRLPDTSPEQLAQMSQRLYSMYPTTEVALSVRAPVETDRTNLSDMLDQLRELRDADAPPSDVAYYGMVRQADSFTDYCQGACTTGIAGFGSQNGGATAGMGVGFPNTAAGTFVHELGHIYRRPHAPCGGAASPDASYPYLDARLGSWGYDLQTHELFDPETHSDLMGYCSPEWISDYNYQQILERIVVVNQLAHVSRIRAPNAPTSYRTLRVARDGTARWGLELHPQLAPPGDPAQLQALDAHGAETELVDAFYETSGEGETAYFIPAGHAAWSSIQVPGGARVPYAEPSDNRPFTR